MRVVNPSLVGNHLAPHEYISQSSNPIVYSSSATNFCFFLSYAKVVVFVLKRVGFFTLVQETLEILKDFLHRSDKIKKPRSRVRRPAPEDLSGGHHQRNQHERNVVSPSMRTYSHGSIDTTGNKGYSEQNMAGICQEMVVHTIYGHYCHFRLALTGIFFHLLRYSCVLWQE
jgi:hypothetical protein